MAHTDFPPFFIGQRVVALTSHNDGSRVKGRIYTVLAMKKCTGCGRWYVDIGDTGCLVNVNCYFCSTIFDYLTTVEWHNANKFTPIEENRERIKYVAVSETLREKAQEVVIENLTTS